MRTEFGIRRPADCACKNCVIYCRFIPGYLIPNDLKRIIPTGIDPLDWAEKNLLSSSGAVVMRAGRKINIPTLVPATQPSGECIFFDSKSQACTIHKVSPFACSMFDSHMSTFSADFLSSEGLNSILEDAKNPNSLYQKIWHHLDHKGLHSLSAIEKRERLNRALGLS